MRYDHEFMDFNSAKRIAKQKRYYDEYFEVEEEDD